MFVKTPIFTLYADSGSSRHSSPQPGYFKYSLPRVPGNLLEGIRGFFRMVSDEYGIEAYAEIWYRSEAHNYEVIIPSQSCGKTFVNYEGETEDESFFKVMSLHSHNTMPAFFSGIDDQDERRKLIYGVFGNFGGTEKALFRACCGGGYFSYIQPNAFSDGAVTADSVELAKKYYYRWQMVAVCAR